MKLLKNRIIVWVVLSLFFFNLLMIFIPSVGAAAPTVTTNAVTNVTTSSATIWGNLTNDGGKGCIVGFDWGTTTSYDNSAFECALPFDLKAQSANYGGPIWALTSDTDYVYAGGSTTRTIRQYYKSNMTLKAESANYGGPIFALTIDDTYVYVGGDITQTIRQYYKSNMTLKAESANYGGPIYALTIDDTYVYAGGDTTQTVRQYWKSNMTYKQQSANYGGTILALTIDDTYVYAGGLTTRTIRQYYKSNMTLKAESANYGGPIWALTSDTDYVYAGGDITQTIRQYYKSNMTLKAESANYGSYIRALTSDTDYVYAGGGGTQTVRQYWKSNMTYKQQSANYGGKIYALTIDDTYVYAGGSTTQTVRQYWKDYYKFSSPYPFNQTLTGLTPGTTYHYRAWASNSDGRTNGSDMTFHTMPPDPVTNETWEFNAVTQNLTITWTRGNYSDYTLIRKSSTGFPTSITDGTLVYNNTGEAAIDTGITTAYAYTLWAYNSTWNSYSSPVYLQTKFSYINVYSENTGLALTDWDIEISNKLGTETFTRTGNSNPLILNSTSIPTGTDISFIISKTNYQPRIYYYEVVEALNLSLYIPRLADEETLFSSSVSVSNPAVNAIVTLDCIPTRIVSVEAWNSSTYGHWYIIPNDMYTWSSTTVEIDSSMLDANTKTIRVHYYCGHSLYNYILTVVDDLSLPVKDAIVEVRRLMNGSYQLMSRTYTDVDGQTSVHLISGVIYKILVSKTGYLNSSVDYIPSRHLSLIHI